MAPRAHSIQQPTVPAVIQLDDHLGERDPRAHTTSLALQQLPRIVTLDTTRDDPQRNIAGAQRLPGVDSTYMSTSGSRCTNRQTSEIVSRNRTNYRLRCLLIAGGLTP